MLREAVDADVQEMGAASFRAAPAARAVAMAAPMPAGRYGEGGSRWNSPAFILTILLHVALVAAMFMVRNHFVHKHAEKLTVLNLHPDIPPPQTTPEPVREIEQPKIVAPRPIVQTPSPPSPVQTTAEPSPPQPVAAPSLAAIPGPPAPPAPASTGVLEKGNIDGDILSAKPPSYPLESRRHREQGTVVLALTIGIDGKVIGIAVRQSSGFARLDDAALDAVRKWKWKPFQQNGQPVIIRGNLAIPFTLQG